MQGIQAKAYGFLSVLQKRGAT